MADQGNTRLSGTDPLEALTADRMKMWNGFTTAATGGVILVVVVLILMALFL